MGPDYPYQRVLLTKYQGPVANGFRFTLPTIAGLGGAPNAGAFTSDGRHRKHKNHARSTQIPPIVAFVEKTPGPTISEIVRLWRFATPARSSFLLVAVLCRIKAKGIDAQKAIPPWSILSGHHFFNWDATGSLVCTWARTWA